MTTRYGIAGVGQTTVTGSGFNSIMKNQVKRLTSGISGSGFSSMAKFKHDNQLNKMPRFIQKARNNIRYQK